jgi:hypothetical protein
MAQTFKFDLGLFCIRKDPEEAFQGGLSGPHSQLQVVSSGIRETELS